MPLYSFHLSCGPGFTEPPRFDLTDDADAAALSICVLRDHADYHQVWVLDGERCVAVRVRDAWDEMGLLLKLA